MMQLYWSPRSRSFTALWLMEETGAAYERVLTDISTGAQRRLEYLAINPMGKVPALKDGDATIAESAVQIATKLEMNPVSAGWGDAQRVFDVLDAALAKGPWILGANFSAADIAIGSALNFGVRLFKMVPSRPSFDAYIARCIARPAFQRAEKIAAP